MNHPLFKQPNAENKNKINEVSFMSMLTAKETLCHSKCVFFFSNIKSLFLWEFEPQL